MVVWPTCSKLSRALSSKRPIAPLDVDIGGILCWRFRLGPARAGGYVVQDDAEKTEQSEGSEHGFKEPLPHGVAPRDLRIAGQVAVALGIGGMLIGYIYLRRGSFFSGVRNEISDWKRRRNMRKFQVYMRDNSGDTATLPDRWVN